MSDRLVALRPTPLAFPLACALEDIGRRAYSAAKSLRNRLRG